MNFNLFNSIILARVIQGFVFAIIWLVSKKYRAQSTYLLITLIIVYSLSNLQYYLLDIGAIEFRSFYDLYQLPFSLLMPPLLLLYGLKLMEPEKPLPKRHKLLFMPFVLIFILGCFYKFQLIFNDRESGYSDFLDAIPEWGEWVAILYSIIVAVFLVIKLNNNIRDSRFKFSVVKPELKWFRNIMILQFFAITLWAVTEYLYASGVENHYYYPVWIVVAIIIYWMGHVGIYKFGIHQERKRIRRVVQDRYSITEPSKQNDHITSVVQYLKVERNFLNPNISLESVAKEINLSAGHLSKIINTDMGMSFKDYLNQLRVEEAKKYITDPDFSNYTLIAIGLEAGFNSKSAFNASFKKITGLTPSEYKNQN